MAFGDFLKNVMLSGGSYPVPPLRLTGLTKIDRRDHRVRLHSCGAKIKELDEYENRLVKMFGSKSKARKNRN